VLTLNYSYLLAVRQGQLFLRERGQPGRQDRERLADLGHHRVPDGQPFSVTYTAPGTPTGQVSGRANRVPGVALYPAVKTPAQWFNPAAFAAPPVLSTQREFRSHAALCGRRTAVYATYGNSGYDMLRGPASRTGT
jgi:hypothetical protein